MRTGRRDTRTAGGLALVLAALLGAAPADLHPIPSVGMTLEIDWSAPSGEPGQADLSVSGGRIVEVVAWPGGRRADPRPDGSWSIGPGTRGRARARVDAPLTAELIVRIGDQSARFPLATIPEGPQRSVPGSPFEVGVERLPWDAIRADLGGPGFDGTAEPGAMVPLSLAFHVVTPEPAEVNLRCSAELRPARGGEPVWRQEWEELVATDAPSPPKHEFGLQVPGPEGTYVLEIRTAWEPVAGPAGTRLGRWVRRRRNPSQATSASRKLSLAVVGPMAAATPPPSKGDGGGVEVDSIDLARSLGHRPMTSGRSPLEGSGRWAWPLPETALVEPHLRDRLRGWLGRLDGPEPSTLAAADLGGLAWTALGLRVAHPERPHRLTLTVAGGHPASLGVAMVAGGNPGRMVLDACASGGPILEGGPPSTFSWPVWPDAEAPVLVLVNRNPSAPVLIGSITLVELVDLPPAVVPADAGRSIGIHLAGPRSLDRFGGGDEANGPFDPLTQSRNLASYLAHIGASTVVLPDGLADRAGRRALDGQVAEDPSGPDRLDLLLRVLARRGASAWIDVPFEGPLPGLPAPDSPEAAARGLVRVDRRGQPDGPAYQPIHPEVRRAMARKVAEAAAPSKARPNLAGVLVRLGPGSTLPGGPDSGLDDVTYARFLAAAFEPGHSARPGQGTADPGRFEARARFVEGSGQLPWLAWRAREVASTYSGLAEEVARSSTRAVLAVSTPALEAGPAGDEARRIDLAGLDPSLAWRGVGLDLSCWPTGPRAPVVFRGSGLSTDDLGHDLATSPELDGLVADRPGRGVLLGVESVGAPAGPRLSARPMAEGTPGDEPLGHALAALDARRVILASSSASGQEDRLRRFARVFATLPPSPAGSPSARTASGVVARAIRSETDTYLALANDTPYPILLETLLQAPAEAGVIDLGRGVQLDPERGPGLTRLVMELGPFGVASARVGSAEARVVSVTPHPGREVLDGMKAHYDDLSTALARLDRGETVASSSGRSGPLNPGFEPETAQFAAARAASKVAGWEVSAEAPAGSSAELDRDRPHSGRGSVRIEARGGPAAVVSEPFRPDRRPALTIRAWLRSDRPDAKVRVRVDGQAGGVAYARQLDVPARGEWAETVVRASQIPDGGLDSARLRFELLGPGRLWVDDVMISGEALSESERLYARRDLTAALFAYRDKKYADFARLAGSHWARNVASGPAPSVAADRSGLIRTGDASALPPGRRVR